MIPICQLNLTLLPEVPENLKDIALITLFIDSKAIPYDKPNGQGWLIRTYSDITELEEIIKPSVDFPIRPFQLKPEILGNVFKVRGNHILF